MAEEKSSIILYHVLESFLFSVWLSVALREVLYTAFTEVKRHKTCAHSTTPLSRVRDSLILSLLGTPSWWCSTMSPHLWSRHCSPRHSSPITRSETWGSTALGHKYTFFLHYWWKNKGSVFNRLAQPESRSGKNSPALRSCTDISLQGDREEIWQMGIHERMTWSKKR